MKQFMIDLITVKSHSNHLGANEGNPFNIARGKKAATETCKPARTRAARPAACLLVYLLFFWPLVTPVLSDSPRRHSGTCQVQSSHSKPHQTQVAFKGLWRVPLRPRPPPSRTPATEPRARVPGSSEHTSSCQGRGGLLGFQTHHRGHCAGFPGTQGGVGCPSHSLSVGSHAWM